MVAIGFGGQQDLRALREQRAIKVILASQDLQVQRVRSAQQAQRVRKDLLDPRGLQEIPLKSETASV